MHHTNLDRVWWSWQKKDLSKRLKDISGPELMMDYTNAQGGNVTMDFPMNLGYNNWDAKVGDTMDIRDLCYTYDRLY
jgi:tyrosinase